MKRGLFITGTDTGIGKTLLTATLLSVLRARGIDAVPMKPVQTGCGRTDDDLLQAPDLLYCLRAAGYEAPDGDEQLAMCPYRFEPACSPHLAARLADRPIAIETIRQHFIRLCERHACVIVEGAGGLLTPLDEHHTMRDLARLLDLPVVVAARPGLGTLNHTQLTIDALRAAGLEIAAIVLIDSTPASDETIATDNAATLAARTGLPVLGPLPHIAGLGDHPEWLQPAPPAFAAVIEPLIEPLIKPLLAALTPAHAAASHVWHPYTRHATVTAGELPDIVRGDGIYLQAADGRRYIDAIASWWCCALGHGHPAITAAIHAQTDRLQHSILGNLSHPPARELALALAGLMPDPQRHIHFASDGASAVEAALKIALQYHWNRGQPQRQIILSLREAYHGDTLGTVALGYLDHFHKPFRSRLTTAGQIPVPPHDGDEAACLAAAHRLMDEAGDTLAAVIVEPLCQGAAGMRLHPPAFLRALCEAAQARGALFIVDEIATGFLRTGTLFAFEQAGIDPDIVCVGKALAAGALPISAAIVKDAVYDTFADTPADHTFYHGHTFAGNPIACAAALAALHLYRDRDFQSQVATRAAALAEGMTQLQAVSGTRDIRHLGLIGAVTLDLGAPAADRRWARRARLEMQRRHYLLRPLETTLYVMPPLVTPPETLLTMIHDLAESLDATRKET